MSKKSKLFISLVICTKDRPKDLASLLNSVEGQGLKPDEVLIIDGSDNPVEIVLKPFKKSLKISYTHVSPPGLTKQRNIGIGLVDKRADYVGFLDDDIVLEDNCIENLSAYLAENPGYAGMGLVINNQPPYKKRDLFLKHFFLIENAPPGKITRSGHAGTITAVNENIDVQWLYGGATFWKRTTFNQFKYDEWYSGVGYMEDVDFSYRVGQTARLGLCASARCFHYHHPVPAEKFFQYGLWQMVSWWYFARKNSVSSLLLFWSSLGSIFFSFSASFVRFSSAKFRYSCGQVKGLVRVLSGNTQKTRGFQKT